MSIQFKNELHKLIVNELQYNYRSMIFTFVVDPMTEQAEFFSTSKFTTWRKLVNNSFITILFVSDNSSLADSAFPIFY